MNRIVRLTTGLVSIVLLTSPAFARDGAASESKSISPKPVAAQVYCPAIDPPPPYAAARRAFVDPVTGQLREPTPEEAARFEAASRAARAARAQALSELQVVVHSDGSRSIDLGDTFLMDLVAQRNSDGTISLGCLAPGSPTVPAPAPIQRLEEK